MTFAHPEFLLAAAPAAAIVLGIAVLRRSTFPSTPRALLAGAVRALSVALLAAALAGPGRDGERETPPATVLVADRSASVGADAADAEAELLRDLHRDGLARRLDFGDADTSDARPALLAAAADRPDRLVLATDGRLDGDAAPLLADLARTGSAAGVVPVGGPGRAPAASASAPRPVLPPAWRAGRPATVRVAAPGAEEVELRVDGRRAGRAPVENGAADFPDVDLPAGRHELLAIARGPKGTAAAAATVTVSGPPVVVVVGADADAPVPAALAAQGVDVRIAADAAAPSPEARVVVLLPGGAVPDRGRGLAAFVRAGGGLFAATGAPPGLAALADDPLGRLLPAEALPPPPEAAPPPEREPPPPPLPEKPPAGASPAKVEKEAVTVSVLLVMDRSGSMSGAKILLARAACYETAKTLDPADRLGVLAFSDEFEWIRPFAAAGDLAGLAADLRRLVPGGGTDIFSAMQQAAETMRKEDSAVRHVILVSDGQDVLTGFKKLLDGMRADGITVSAVGVGLDYEPRFVNTIAEWGGGASWQAIDPRDLPAVVTMDTRRVLDAKREIERERSKDVTAGPEKPPDEPSPPPEPERPPEPPPAKPVPVRAAPAPVLAGLEFPPLPEVEPERARFPARVALATEGGAPVLTLWRFGGGRVAHLAADPAAWADWPDLGRFLAQLVRLLAGGPGDAVAPAPAIEVRPGAILVRTDGGEPKLVAEGPGGERELPLERSGPATWRAAPPEGAPGEVFLLRATTPEGGVAVAAAVAPAAPEAPRGVEPAAIARLAAAAGRPAGRIPPEPRPARRPGREPLELPFLVAALALLPVDTALRRIRR